ncbi:fat [Brachionus plicatilis]|uniref:Fat n=1 Tax=Brachionus plicatilis TaxID=10195 RepID=A0A3M7P1R0_BRAPC|nr:fat [Brachionus plicatilis]
MENKMSIFLYFFVCCSFILVECQSSPCDSSPCLNDAVCIAQFNSTFVCSCMPNYTGRFCETAIDRPCLSSPCQNGGLCASAGDSFNCICLPGYSGLYCENSKYCNQTTCLNGGLCLESNETSISCWCINGYYGDTY